MRLFVVGFDGNAVRSIMRAAATATQNRIQHVHLLFQSGGGIVGDGIALYNFFKSLPFELTLYNTGAVSSIAALAFLGAKNRMTTIRATFMIHRSTNGAQFATGTKLRSLADSLDIDDKRCEAILRDHFILTKEQWSDLDKELVFFRRRCSKGWFCQ